MTHPTPFPPAPLRSADIFLHLIVAFLAPMFLAATGGDIACARLAAMETVNAYRARSHADLLSIAQIIAFGLATLSSLSLSMADDLPLSMTLRLRNNATSLNRAADQSRRTLRDAHPAEPARHHQPDADPDDDDTLNEATVLAKVARTHHLAAEREAAMGAVSQPPAPIAAPAIDPEQQHRTAWAASMTRVAKEVTANLASLPPAERRAATIQAAALSATAADLMSDVPFPPPAFEFPPNRV
jgi:hypothetical protein